MHAFEPFKPFEPFEPFEPLGPLEPLESFTDDIDDDEEALRIEQAHWALEVQSQVALMNARTRF
jgi:hypothetical protein